MRRRHGWIYLLAGFVLLAWPSAALAHSGAPYPVLLEEQVGPYVASALADPDVGTGTFYILAAMPDDTPPSADTVVTVWIRPEDGHVEESGYRAERQQTRDGERFVAKVPFDTKGPWQVRLALEGSAGNGEIAFPVEVTPKGSQWLQMVACLVPFVVLGLLWLRASRRQTKAQENPDG